MPELVVMKLAIGFACLSCGLDCDWFDCGTPKYLGNSPIVTSPMGNPKEYVHQVR